jgi:hypothetical protein
MTKQCQQSNINNDGNNKNDGDGSNNSKGIGNNNDAATTANGYDVNENDSGDSRTAIGQRQLNDNDGATTM